MKAAAPWSPTLPLVSGRIGRWGVYLLAFGIFLSPPYVSVAQGLIVLAFLADGRRGFSAVWHSFYGKLLVFFSAYVLVLAGWAAVHYGFAANQFEQAFDFLRTGLFCVAGWVIYRSRVRLRNIAVALFSGLCVGLVAGYFSPPRPHDAFVSRFEFWSTHPNFSSLLLGMTLIALFTAMIDLSWMRRNGTRVLVSAAFVAGLFAVGLIALVHTYSRNGWVAFGIGFVSVVILALFLAFRTADRRVVRTSLVSLAGLALVTIWVGAVKFEYMHERVTQEAAVLSSMFAGDIEAIPYNSAGTRVHLWAFGLQKFVERPVFGHGPYFHHLIIASDLQNKHGYLHNSYLEMLVRLGLFGAVFFIAGLGWLARELVRCRHHPQCGCGDLLVLFAAASFIVLASWSVFDYRFNQWDFTSLVWLFFGLMFSKAMEVQALRESEA